MKLAMKRQDLIELYQLAKLYVRTYDCNRDTGTEFLSQLQNRYLEQFNGKSIEEACNPRGAGRKAVYTKKENDRIAELREEGLSLRAVAKAAGCSLGHVQDVLYNKKDVC